MILSTSRSGIVPAVLGKQGSRRTMATAATRAARKEGSIADIFTSLTDESHISLPERFVDVKRGLWNDGLVESWRQVLQALEPTVENIAAKGSDIVPRVSYAELTSGLSRDKINTIKQVGTVVVTGAVDKEQALGWKQSIRDYAQENTAHVKGFPPDNIQVFEIYNSKAQTQARTHPGIINTQKFLLSLWNKPDPATEVSLQTPISYFDRLRIRQPGDAKFTLGPHTDGGSVEQWEDPAIQHIFRNILKGGSAWRRHDPFDVTPRIAAKQDLYNTPNACSIFRAWQGWTAMSSTGLGEGTLRVLPMLSLASAYILLRPFFRPRDAASSSLKFEDWVPDLDSPAFPGSSIGKTQELNEQTHPHLQLARTMVSVPRVEPGDQVYWHCDAVHAVEGHHQGRGDSSVLYIPAVPLTVHNANYLRDQRINFLAGLPPPDFPGGAGETEFVGRGTAEDIPSSEGREMYGLQAFAADSSKGMSADFAQKVNLALQ
ncbi:hypothetical protein HYPSUDRAFT_33048 [Hypholoma sublateritium FD-334 SS-4]|uniref:DUF1479-domain-containing protein n=1 Tax=Hypholoma sublateritium (strain FD-334 SS-4) TaxID=945553 RepID=A0A0D2PD28_HYPSF|nr:hypothetical protein HYPSUDRAFT_33048 [Hypholoma sublateritium FD-334 SS-4]